MKEKTVGKIATVLMVLLMVLSGMMVLQYSARADERQEGTVEGIVYVNGGSSIPSGLNIRLIDLSDNQIQVAQTGNGGYFEFDNVDVGYYRVEFKSQDYNNEMVYFEGVKNHVLVEDSQSTFVEMTVDAKEVSLTLNGTVTTSTGDVSLDTEIMVEDIDSSYSTSVGILNKTTGYYEVPLYEGNFTVKVTAPDYPPYINYNMRINEGNSSLDVALTKDPQSPLVTGYIWSEEGNAVKSELQVTLFSEEKGIFHTSINNGPYFQISVPTGNYTIIVDSVGYLPYHEDITVENGTNALGINNVQESGEETIHTTMNFTDWNNFVLTRERTYQPDTRIEGMDYSYLGLLPLQIDLALGNQDLVLSYSELQTFKDELEYMESNIPSSQKLTNVDGTSYSLNSTTTWEVEMPGLEGSGDSVSVFDVTEVMTSTSVVEYDAVESIPTKEQHTMNLYLNKDNTFGNYRDYTYSINLPTGFERTNTPQNIDLNGYKEISMDPASGTGKLDVELNIEQSEAGEVNIVLDQGPMVHKKDIEDMDYYIIKEDTNVSCTADFQDPVGSEEDAVVRWYLDNSEIGSGMNFNYVFSSTGEKSLEVEVEETGGQITSDEVTVLVDGEAPVGDIIADNVTVAENQQVKFSGEGFVDNGGDGIIRDFEWNFSDGSDHELGMNVTHSYALKGTYTVTLNVTDVVGNYRHETIQITVTDATKPVAIFTLTYGEGEDKTTIESHNLTGQEIEQENTVTLDASKSFDPAGYDGVKGDIASENVTWWIKKDNEKETGMKLDNYSFKGIGTYTITLNVTDEKGNYHNISRNVEITLGPTPDLEISNLRVSGEKRDGNELTIIFNVTNFGEKKAEDIEVFFKVDGEDVAVSSITFEKDGEESNSTILTGEKKVLKFKWTPDGDGEKTLNVTVADGEEPDTLQGNNYQTKDINIEPPAWRRYLVYALIPIVIIGVTVGLYFYRERMQ